MRLLLWMPRNPPSTSRPNNDSRQSQKHFELRCMSHFEPEQVHAQRVGARAEFLVLQPAQDDGAQFGKPAANDGQHLQAVHARHFQIADQQPERLGFQQCQRPRADVAVRISGLLGNWAEIRGQRSSQSASSSKIRILCVVSIPVAHRLSPARQIQARKAISFPKAIAVPNLRQHGIFFFVLAIEDRPAPSASPIDGTKFCRTSG